MASTYWQPATTTPVAQVVQVTIGGTIGGSDTFTLACMNEAGTVATVTSDAGPTTAAAHATDLFTKWNASSDAQMTAVTATNPSSGVILLTADTAGVPFYIAYSKSSASGTVAILCDGSGSTAVNLGPNDWNSAGNWSNGLPSGSNNAWIQSSANEDSILYGLIHDGGTYGGIAAAGWYPVITAVTVPVVNIAANFTHYIGTSTAYLKIGVTHLDVGQDYTGAGTGSQRIKINLGTVQSLVNVYSSALISVDGLEPIQLLCNNTATVINCWNGTIGIASDTGEASTLNKIDCAQPSTTLNVNIGDVTYGGTAPELINNGATITGITIPATVTHVSGNTTLTAASGTITLLETYGGVFVLDGAVDITTAQVHGGLCYPGRSVTTLHIYRDGVANFLSSLAGTITTLDALAGGKLLLDPNLTTITYSQILTAMQIEVLT